MQIISNAYYISLDKLFNFKMDKPDRLNAGFIDNDIKSVKIKIIGKLKRTKIYQFLQ